MEVLGAFLDETSLAGLERPEHEVVFFAVEADGQIVAVRFEVEEDARALIELSGQQAKADRDFAVVKIIDILRDGVREIRVGFHTVDELFVFRAVNRARFRSEAGRRLAFDPLPSIDLQDGSPRVVLRDAPIAHNGQKLGWRDGTGCYRRK